MFAIANINGMSLTTAVSTNFVIARRSGFTLAIKETMFAIANNFSMTWAAVESVGKGNKNINHRFRRRRENGSNQLAFLLSYMRENFRNGWQRIHKQNMGSNIVVLFVQSTQKLHHSIFEFTLSKERLNFARALRVANADELRSVIFHFVPNNAKFGEKISNGKSSLLK